MLDIIRSEIGISVAGCRRTSSDDRARDGMGDNMEGGNDYV